MGQSFFFFGGGGGGDCGKGILPPILQRNYEKFPLQIIYSKPPGKSMDNKVEARFRYCVLKEFILQNQIEKDASIVATMSKRNHSDY